MKKIILLVFVLVFFLSIVFETGVSIFLAENPETKVYVDPSISEAVLSENFTVNIKIANAVNVYSWQFVLSWDPTILAVQDVQEGSFLNQHIHPTIFQDYINNEAGNLTVVCVLKGEPRESSAKGNGTLATIAFYVKDYRNSDLQLYDTLLLDYDLLGILHETEDGSSIIIPEFPSFLVLPLFTITLLLAVILCRRKHPK